MKITITRRISQIVFFLMFVWFCIVCSVGDEWWKLRAWPANWFLQLDPLVALGTVLTTGSLYSSLAWAVATILLTILVGRFFCGWVCPFGTIHQFAGFLGKLGKTATEKISLNQYRSAQNLKYYLLIFLLSATFGSLITNMSRSSYRHSHIVITVFGVSLVALAVLTAMKVTRNIRKAFVLLLVATLLWIFAGFFVSPGQIVAGSLQTGILDPIPLVYRSVNMVLLPIVDSFFYKLWPVQRYCFEGWWIGIIFLLAVSLNFVYPRFYCRFICPLGALLGVLGKFAIWRIGTNQNHCTHCKMCEIDCEGACEPFEKIRLGECVLCMNCLHVCKQDVISYQILPSTSGEIVLPDVSRRKFVFSVIAGASVIPMTRLSGITGPNWNAGLIRPPGSLAEEDFLNRCIKCGQCMRICPSNIIQPAGIEYGLENMWTPVLDFRSGTSGCQPNCVACTRICPTAAIRPITVDERMARNQFAGKKPVRMGTAFVDRGRCLPWAMSKPCIVCQENCPVSPKAIFVEECFQTIRDGVLIVKKAEKSTIELQQTALAPGRFGTGDYYCTLPGGQKRQIVQNTETSLTLSVEKPWQEVPAQGTIVEIQIRLQKPCIDVEKCIGCGICEHECPVSGKKPIYVTAENESRSKKKCFLS